MNHQCAPLRLISFKELVDGPSPDRRARDDLERYADRLRSISVTVSKLKHGIALSWITEWRMYCFERNPKRWPDGKYYLLNRNYDLWRGHRVAYTREELSAIGCDEWDSRAIRAAHDESFVPLEADCFHNSPKRKLEMYVELVKRLSEAFARRLR